MDTGFFGQRGTDDWSDSDFRPKDWRETVLYLYPNGDAPLTALTALMKSERATDPEYYWFTKGLPTQGGAITNVFTNSALSTAYTTGGTAGDTLYIQISAARIAEIRVGHQVLLRDSSDETADTNAKVTARIVNGANSYATVVLLEDDPTTTGIAGCDTLLIIGNINSEGAGMPDAIQYDPVKYYNLTQIFRNSLDITRTARRTKLRTYEQYKEAKREALQLHAMEMEKAYLWGIMTEGTGANGKPERTTKGLIPWIKGAAADGATISNYSADDAYATEAGTNGKTWLQGGGDWMDVILEHIFRYGGDERMAFCGSGVILALNKFVKNQGSSQFSIGTTTGAYGIKVTEWVTPFGAIYFKRHPLFSYEATNRNSCVIFDPKDVMYKYIDDTTFYGQDPKKVSTSGDRLDGTKEEYLTEAGLEFHHPAKCAYLTGFGSDNA